MNKFKKSLAVLMVSVLSAALWSVLPAFAASKRTVATPFAQHSAGMTPHPLYSGAKKSARLTNATETLIVSGAAVLYGIYLTTGAATNFVTLRDTDTANGSGTIALDKLSFQTTPQSDGNRLPFPIRFDDGITAQLNNVAAGEEAVVLYLEIE